MEFDQQFVPRPDGEQVGVQVYPSSDSSDTLALILPAMGVPARYYRPLAAALIAHGMDVAVMDLRGTGASSPPPSRASTYRYADLVDDLDAVLETLKPQRDHRRTLLIGHSLGGQIAALHLAVSGRTDVAGLALVAVGLPYWRRYARHGARIFAFTQGINVVAQTLRRWPGWGFGGVQARGVIGDWAHTARTGHFRPIDGVDVEAAFATLRTPVLALSIEGDQYTPAATTDCLTGKMTGAPVVREHVTVPGLNHFTWVRAGAGIPERITTWATTLP